MTGCVESNPVLIHRDLDETIERLAPTVESFLQHIAPNETVTSQSDGCEFRITVPVRFPDGIGRGRVVANLFRYRETVRLDIELAHNRVFAGPDGTPSPRRCFLNDFVATVTLPAGASELPIEFRRNVISGIRAAQQAVQDYNRRHTEPWNRMKVVGV